VPATTQPQLWLFRHRLDPETMARRIARDFATINRAAPQVEAGPDGEWQVTSTSDGVRGPLTERWVCRAQDGRSYTVGMMARPEVATAWAADITAMLASARLLPGPELQVFREPTERAYRLWMPRDWTWEGRIVRADGVPGAFEYKVQAPDRLTGAFNAAPALFNINTPYLPAAECARQIVLPALAQQIPGLKLERVREQPRAGAFFREAIRAAGLGANPRVDRVEADYAATVGGTTIRVRTLQGTVQFDASPLLGGRGNWQLTVNGAWAPADRFDQLYPIGRGVVASIRTDPKWRADRAEATDVVSRWRRDLAAALGEAWDEFVQQ
jgi:hypothetical protein